MTAPPASPPAAPRTAPAPAGPAALSGRRERDLLCALAYVHLGVRDSASALPLLELADRGRPDDVEVLRLLAYAHLIAGDGQGALGILDRLAGHDPAAVPYLLLRSRALHLLGRLDEARACFRRFVGARPSGEEPRPC